MNLTMSTKSYLHAIRGHHRPGPAMQLQDYHKVAQDYIRAGVRGADLVQRVMNSSSWELVRTQKFLIEYYPLEVEEVINSLRNTKKPISNPAEPCPKCGRPLGGGVTRCSATGRCDYVLPR